jgi:type VI secretion system protein ImpG
MKEKAKDIYRYYQEELDYLYQAGERFSQLFPERAAYLDFTSKREQDPHVRRLLEAFAFLTGGLRQRLDDYLPEVSQGLLAVVCPHYLRPMPSATILQLTPLLGKLKDSKTIPGGTPFLSQPIKGRFRCEYRTSWDLRVDPLDIVGIRTSEEHGRRTSIGVTFRFHEGLNSVEALPDDVQLFFNCEYGVACRLWNAFFHSLEAVLLRPLPDERQMPKSIAPAVSMVGFTGDEFLLPYPVGTFPGYRLIEEYFWFPEKFHFCRVGGLALLREFPVCTEFELEFVFRERIEDLRLQPDSLLLHCIPAVNLTPRNAKPVIVDGRRTKYLVRPESDMERDLDIFSIERVEGAQGARRKVKAIPYYTFLPHEDIKTRQPVFLYDIQRSERLPEDVESTGQERLLGWETWVSCLEAPSVGDGREEVSEDELVLSMDLLCLNRELPHHLHVHEIRHKAEAFPDFVGVTNRLRPTKPLWPSLKGPMKWALIAHLGLNMQAIRKTEHLQAVLALYDRLASRANQQRRRGIGALRESVVTKMHKGLPVRGVRLDLEIDTEMFEGRGDAVLFSTVLNNFFSMYSSFNSFIQLTCHLGQDERPFECPLILLETVKT